MLQQVVAVHHLIIDSAAGGDLPTLWSFHRVEQVAVLVAEVVRRCVERRLFRIPGAGVEIEVVVDLVGFEGVVHVQPVGTTTTRVH